MSWTNDEVLEFVELYRREQLLWDPKHPLHRNRSEVTDAWLRIQNSLNRSCSITDLKKKKESLMTSFRMHWNKKKKSQQEAYQTTWFAYPLMESFLGGKYECDSTMQIENEFYSNSGSYTNPSQTTQGHNTVSATIERSDGTGRIRPPICQPNLGERETNGDFDFTFSKKYNTNYLKRTADEKSDMDEYDLYCQLLATKLRKLDEHQRDVAMHEIDNIMFRAKMQSGPPRSFNSSPSPVPRKMKSPVFIVTQAPNHNQFEDENMGYQEHNMQTQPPP